MILKKATCYKITNMEAVTRESLELLNDHPVTEPHKTQLSSIGWRHAYDDSGSFEMPIPFAEKRVEYEATALLLMDSISSVFCEVVNIFGGYDD